MGFDEMNDIISVVASVLLFGFAGNTVGGFVGDWTTQDPIGMQLVNISYENGYVTQRHEVIGAVSIIADWAAQIQRNDVVLCSGGAKATYNGVTDKRMTVDVWVGDDCPDLQSGDILTASWEYLDSQNLRHRISGTKIIE